MTSWTRRARWLLFGAGVATLCAWVLLPVSLTGEGGGGGSFSWTAAAYLVLAEVDSRRDTSSG